MPDSPSPAPPMSQSARLAVALYGRASTSSAAPASSSTPAAPPASAPAAAPAPAPGTPPRFFSKAEKLAQVYTHRDQQLRPPPPAPAAPPAPAPAPAPPAAADGAPPPAGAAPTPASAPDAGAVLPLELDVPEGLNAADPLLVELKTSGAKLGLDKAKASAVLGLHAKVSAAQDAQLEAMHASWTAAARADEEIGGDGFAVAMADARSTLREFGTPELHRVLGAFHLGENPEVIRLLARVSRELHRARSL